MSEQIIKIGNHELVHITEVRELRQQLAEWKRCAEMLRESLNPPPGPSGEAIIDQQRDAEELFAKLHDGAPVVDQLAETNEYARKLSIKVTDQGRDIQRFKAALWRKEEAGDLVYQELDDKTPPRNCSCHLFPPCSDCTNHAASRRALKAWKEANQETTTTPVVRYVEEVNGGMGPDYAEVYLSTGQVIQVNNEGLIVWPTVEAYQSGENEVIEGSHEFEAKETNK